MFYISSFLVSPVKDVWNVNNFYSVLCLYIRCINMYVILSLLVRKYYVKE